MEGVFETQILEINKVSSYSGDWFDSYTYSRIVTNEYSSLYMYEVDHAIILFYCYILCLSLILPIEFKIVPGISFIVRRDLVTVTNTWTIFSVDCRIQ